MLGWAVVFLIIALVAAIFGFGGIAAASAGIAKLLFVIFLVLFIISLIFGWRGRRVPELKKFSRVATPARQSGREQSTRRRGDWVACVLCSLRFRADLETDRRKTVGQPLRLPRQAMRLPCNSLPNHARGAVEFYRQRRRKLLGFSR